MSIAKIKTVAFVGIDAINIDVQIHIGPGLPVFTIVGLPDKSIGEAKERVRAAFNVMGLSLPAKRITINMSPASLPKEGSHYDLPIAVGLLVAMNLIPRDAVENWLILGELALDGTLQKVPGALMAGMLANTNDEILVCPFDSAAEAKLASQDLQILPIKKLIDLLSHIKGENIIIDITACEIENLNYDFDMNQVKGQAVAKRALEIAAAGNFHLLMIGAPGVGKSMLAKRMITILPELTTKECVEVTMIYSIANKLPANLLKRKRPYRDPHHSASLPALVGGGAKALPGEISLAHNGVLFLDELGQYSRALEGLRESMETGQITIARAQNHITYPAKAQIIAAMNPCKCGYFGTIKACNKAPMCAQEYQNKISGPIMDRFDLVIHMDNDEKFIHYDKQEEDSLTIKNRVIDAINFQKDNLNHSLSDLKIEELKLNTDANNLLINYCTKNHFSQRSYTKIARIARVVANLDSSIIIEKKHLAEAVMYKRYL